MKIPKYFIWRLTQKESWRVYGTKIIIHQIGQVISLESADGEVRITTMP